MHFCRSFRRGRQHSLVRRDAPARLEEAVGVAVVAGTLERSGQGGLAVHAVAEEAEENQREAQSCGLRRRDWRSSSARFRRSV